MLSPQANRWQMALQDSVQADGLLVDSVEGGQCCLGVGLLANGVDREDLVEHGMPEQTDLDKDTISRALPVPAALFGPLAMLNDGGMPHRIIGELLIDFWLTGDDSEIRRLSGQFL